MISDGYAQWYADRLWQLLPEVYRTMDAGPTANAAGPLRELVNRIGAQAAVVRRSIDRLGENQSIETCDDWVIPYIGDLVATRLVSCLDAAAQRIDVAKTVYYRRRAGTVGLLEELCADIASRDARVVEFFRRMARTRHQFDPPLSYQIENPLNPPIVPVAQSAVNLRGAWSAAANYFANDQVTYYDFAYLASAASTGKEPDQNPSIWQQLPQQQSLEVVEGLIGTYSGTPAGGFADLRNRYAAANTGTAFDEYAYTADLRAGGETLGHFNIRNLGVFLWWLQAFPISAATPVSSGGANPCFTFDPTGRDIPLFAPSQRVNEAKAWGEHWVSPDEWMLPVAIREVLWNTVPDKLYSTIFSPQAFSVGLMAGGSGAAYPLNQLSILPERGRYSFTTSAPGSGLAVCYNFGLMSEIGAGGYDSAILSDLDLPPNPTGITGGFSSDLNKALKSVSGSATIQIGDSLTYVNVSQSLTVPEGATVAVTALSGQRPVLRWPGTSTPTWTITGQANSNSSTPTMLVLEGTLFQGANIVLAGAFDSVYLRMVTVDPGTAYVPPLPGKGTPPSPLPLYGTAIDGTPLQPVTINVQAAITNLIIERSIVGPIRTSNGGAVEQLTATDSIIQSIPTHVVATTGKLQSPTVFDYATLATSLKYGTNAMAVKAVAGNSALENDLKNYTPGQAPSTTLETEILVAISQFTPAEAEAAWPLALADLALGLDEGSVSLSRCTVLGPMFVHRLNASESILDNLATVEDPQDGCVRFSAYAAGSNLHQPYRSVEIDPGALIFASRLFGRPEYAQLRSDADLEILAQGSGAKGCGCSPEGEVAASILTGAQNGAEMGVYCLEAVALKRRGLALKFEEYSPIGQLPVWIDVN